MVVEFAAILARDLNLRVTQVEAAIALLDAGNTLPFIARYRKEMTDSLDEEQLRRLFERLNYLRKLAERKTTVLESITEQGRLTPELEHAIQTADKLQSVEDLYQPFKPKRRTRAMIARERGLEPLAELILAQPLTRDSLAKLAAPFLSEAVSEVDAVWAGARDIVAETISDDADLRSISRTLARDRGELTSALIDTEKDPRKTFAQYYEFNIPVTRLRPHQTLALNRGEASGALRVRFNAPDPLIMARLAQKYPPNPRSSLAEQLSLATRDGYERLLLPAIERDVRSALSDEASAHAVQSRAITSVHIHRPWVSDWMQDRRRRSD